MDPSSLAWVLRLAPKSVVGSSLLWLAAGHADVYQQLLGDNSVLWGCKGKTLKMFCFFLKGKQYSVATALDWPSECFTSRVRHRECCAKKDSRKSPSAKMRCETPPRGALLSRSLSALLLWQHFGAGWNSDPQTPSPAPAKGQSRSWGATPWVQTTGVQA